MKPITIAFAAGLLALAAGAQAQTGQPLNLKLPPNDGLPASAPASAGSAKQPPSSAPGVYYGDHSGRMSDNPQQFAHADKCDDATYNQAQMHGSLDTGVVAGSHIRTGSYQGGTVDITKNLGDCDHPTGSIGLSIGVSQFNGGGFRGR